MRIRIGLVLTCLALAVPAAAAAGDGIVISKAEIQALPDSGPGWDEMFAAAQHDTRSPDLSNQDDQTDVDVLAKAFVYARRGEAKYRDEVIQSCMAAIGTEDGGRTLALARNLSAYCIAAELVGLPSADDQKFRAWLDAVRYETLDGKTLISTHEDRPNNWGTHAGAARLAAAVYLDDRDEMIRCVQVFWGWCGARWSYAGFEYGDLSWQADKSNPVGINPYGSTIQGHPVGGVLPDDQRRGGGFSWPPQGENYVHEALQGVLLTAVIFDHLGWKGVWWIEVAAIFRAFHWCKEYASFEPTGDDAWEAQIINHFYRVDYLHEDSKAGAGKGFGWTAWLYQ